MRTRKSAADFSTLTAAVGAVIPVPGYTDGVIRDGTAFGQPGVGRASRRRSELSGPRRVRSGRRRKQSALSAARRHRRSGRRRCTESEVRTLLQSALDVANRARAQIRRPVGSQARVTISVVDSQGVILRRRSYARRAAVRHGRVVAEGAHRCVHVLQHGGEFHRDAARREISQHDRCIRQRRALDSVEQLCGSVAHVPQQSHRACRRTDRLHRSRLRQPRATVLSRRHQRRESRAAEQTGEASGVRSRPACSWTWP